MPSVLATHPSSSCDLRFPPSRTSSSLLYPFSDAAPPQSYDRHVALRGPGENAPMSLLGVLRTDEVTGAQADVSDCWREWMSEPLDRVRCIS